MEDFKDVMSRNTNSKLLEITTSLRDDYNREAVIAAETELKKRSLTDQELADIRSELDRKRLEKEQSTKSCNVINDIVSVINPLAEKTVERKIKIVTIGLTLIFLIYLIRNWSLTVLLLQDIGNADISLLEYFAPLILFPIGIYGFWTMKKYGWAILAILLTYLIIVTLFAIGLGIKWTLQKHIQIENSSFIQMQDVENSVLDFFFSKTTLPFYIGQFALFVGFFVFLSKKQIVEKFVLKKQTKLMAIGLTAITVIIWEIVMLM